MQTIKVFFCQKTNLIWVDRWISVLLAWFSKRSKAFFKHLHEEWPLMIKGRISSLGSASMCFISSAMELEKVKKKSNNNNRNSVKTSFGIIYWDRCDFSTENTSVHVFTSSKARFCKIIIINILDWPAKSADLALISSWGSHCCALFTPAVSSKIIHVSIIIICTTY